jgi:chemotaxis response regulator CheB
VLVQDAATAEASTMPAAVLRSVEGARVLPLDRIAPTLLALTTVNAIRNSGGISDRRRA